MRLLTWLKWRIVSHEPLRKFLWKMFFADTSDMCRRADVVLELDSLIWENRDRPRFVRELQDLQTRI